MNIEDGRRQIRLLPLTIVGLWSLAVVGCSEITPSPISVIATGTHSPATKTPNAFDKAYAAICATSVALEATSRSSDATRVSQMATVMPGLKTNPNPTVRALAQKTQDLENEVQAIRATQTVLAASQYSLCK